MRYAQFRPINKSIVSKSTGKVLKTRDALGREVDRKVEVKVCYRNLEDLSAKISPISSRLLKEDVLKELPPKTYQVRPFEMSKKQRATYDELRTQYMVEIEGE